MTRSIALDTPATLVPTMPSKVVLVVDDEPSLQYIYGRTLRGHGFEVHQANTAAAAIAVAETIRVDAVLLDIGLPGRSGLEVLGYGRNLAT